MRDAAPPRTRAVSFAAPSGERLAGTLTLAQPPTQRCVLLCHGYACTRDSMQLPALAAALAGAGFNSLRFDFSGNGESEGAFRLGNYEQEAAQIAAALEHLEQQQGQAVVALLGHSKGGDSVLLFASRHDGRVPRVINLAGRFDLKQGVSERFGASIYDRVQAGPVVMGATRDPGGQPFRWTLTAEDLQARLDLDMPAAAAAIRESKVLTIHGTEDRMIPVTDGRAFAAVVPGSRLVEVEGADHNFTDPQHAAAMIDAVLGFVREGQEW